MNKILKDYGWCKVIQKGDEFFLSYDAGGIAIQMEELKVTKTQAETAMLNQFEAEKIVTEILRSKQI